MVTLIKCQECNHRNRGNPDNLSGMQSMQLPYMSASLRETALEYKLLDNLSTKRETLITQATLDYLNIYYNVDHMPKFCKTGIIRDMESSISSFLQVRIFRMMISFLFLIVRVSR